MVENTTKIKAQALSLGDSMNKFDGMFKDRQDYKKDISNYKDKLSKSNLKDSEISDYKEKIKTLEMRLTTKEEEITSLKKILTSENSAFKTKVNSETVGESISSSDPKINSPFESYWFENLKESFKEIRNSWYSNLNVLQQICLNLLVLDSILIVCIINISFIYFGDYLIKRFELEFRYPKLAKFISLRKIFQNYYKKINILLMAVIIIGKILFYISVISL